MISRRILLAAGLGTSVGVVQAAMRGSNEHPARGARMLLILGGTGFIGPHLTQAAMERGWSVSHFNRGRRDADGVAGVETLIGDRSGSLDTLRGRRWDAVVDNSGYVPKYVLSTSKLLAPVAAHLLFVSSISAYASFERPNDERSPTAPLPDAQIEKVTNETYGPMKALCERHVRDAFGRRATIVRPGYIVGPGDTTDRFTYWVARAARGGEMLAPGAPSDPIQVIDVRDLVDWMLRLVERRVPGTFNAVSAPRQYSIGDLVDGSVSAAGAGAARAVWVPESFLRLHGALDGVDLSPWSPGAEGAAASLNSTDRALRAGLELRPMRSTIEDTLAWFRSLPAERQATLRAGLTAARERDTLDAWRRENVAALRSSAKEGLSRWN